jgi:hypothetical protein
MFLIAFAPIGYFILNIEKRIYKIPELIWFLGGLDASLTALLGITWLFCIGKLKYRAHQEQNEQIEAILFMLLGFLTAFENAIAAFTNYKDHLGLAFIFSGFRVFSVSFQCAFISNFEHYFVQVGHPNRLFFAEIVSIVMFFYNIFIFAINCTIGNVFGNSPISTISTILMAASIHYRLDSAIYFAHFSFGSSLQQELQYDPCASTILSISGFSQEIVSLKKGRYRLRGGSSGMGKAIAYVVLGVYSCLKTFKYFASKDVPLALRIQIGEAILTSEILFKVLVSFGLCFCALFAWKTLRHVIDRTNSQSMWKFYIRLIAYGSIFLFYYVAITILNIFNGKGMIGLVTALECVEAICQIMFLMMFHSRKSSIDCDFSSFWIFCLWFFTIYNVLFALMYVVEEVCDPHHLFPIFDSFGVGLSVAFRILCGTMYLNLVTQGVWTPEVTREVVVE